MSKQIIDHPEGEPLAPGDGDAAYWEAEGIHDDVVKPLWEEIPALDNPELLSDDVKEQ